MTLRHYTLIYDDERPLDYQFRWHGGQTVIVLRPFRANWHWEEVDVFTLGTDLEPLTLEQRLAEVLDSVAGWLEDHPS